MTVAVMFDQLESSTAAMKSIRLRTLTLAAQ
jgi:hypothetical protein